MITEIEEQMLDYIEQNDSFLKSFHNIYHRKYKQLIKGHNQKEYIVTAAIQMNKLKGYSNYTELCCIYLKTLGKGDTEYGEQLHNYYYDTFVLNMEEELQRLKKQYNKTDDDIYIAYEIKTIWSFYNGFMIEKIIREAIEKEATYTSLTERTEEERQQIDTQMSIDIEVSALNTLLGFQIKSYTYLGIEDKEKNKHIEKQNKYIQHYDNAEAFYILYKDNKPIYQIKNKDKAIPYVSYLFTQKDIMEIKDKHIEIGSYIGLAKYIDNIVWIKDKLKN